MITVCTRCHAILDDAEDEIVLVGSGYQHEACAKKSQEWEDERRDDDGWFRV